MLALDLSGTWKLADFDQGLGEPQAAQAWELDDRTWLDAPVPGNVHSALAQAGRIPTPFYHLNLEACRWVEEREWWYRRSFELEARAAPDERQTLVFDGLDTLCTIYLNGERLGRHENMFVEARLDATGRLR